MCTACRISRTLAHTKYLVASCKRFLPRGLTFGRHSSPSMLTGKRARLAGNLSQLLLLRAWAAHRRCWRSKCPLRLGDWTIAWVFLRPRSRSGNFTWFMSMCVCMLVCCRIGITTKYRFMDILFDAKFDHRQQGTVTVRYTTTHKYLPNTKWTHWISRKDLKCHRESLYLHSQKNYACIPGQEYKNIW